MLIRFRTGLLDVNTGHPAGIFRAVAQVMDDPSLPDYQHDYLTEILDWFQDQLPDPDGFQSLDQQPVPQRHGNLLA